MGHSYAVLTAQPLFWEHCRNVLAEECVEPQGGAVRESVADARKALPGLLSSCAAAKAEVLIVDAEILVRDVSRFSAVRNAAQQRLQRSDNSDPVLPPIPVVASLDHQHDRQAAGSPLVGVVPAYFDRASVDATVDALLTLESKPESEVETKPSGAAVAGPLTAVPAVATTHTGRSQFALVVALGAALLIGGLLGYCLRLLTVR